VKKENTLITLISVNDCSENATAVSADLAVINNEIKRSTQTETKVVSSAPSTV
jgi:hypothetical protein